MMIPAQMIRNRGLEVDREYVVNEGPGFGARYRVVNAPASAAFGIADGEYVIPQVFSKIGWTPIKTPARIDRAIFLMTACSEVRS